MSQQKVSLFTGRNQVRLFKEFIINQKVDGYSIVFDKATQKISSLDKFGNVSPISDCEWRGLCNELLDDYNVGVRDDLDSKYHISNDSMLNMKEFKTLTIAESRQLRKDILEEHHNKTRLLPIYSPFLEKLRKIDIKSINPDILNVPFWKFKDTELNRLGAGVIHLRKMIRERLLYEMGIIIPQMMDCYIYIGKPQMGKSAIGELLCDPENVNDEYQTLEDSFNLNTYDKVSLFSKARFIELAETSVMSKEPGKLKDFVTKMKLDSREAGNGMTKTTVQRGYVIYGTSNYRRCIAEEVSGRRFIPLEIESINPEIGNDVHEGVAYLKNNIMNMYALELKNLDDGMTPDSFGENSPMYKEFGNKLEPYQKPYIILKENKNESSIELLDYKLDNEIDFNIRKYPVSYGVFEYLVGNKVKNLTTILRESGWEKYSLAVRVDGKVKKLSYWYFQDRYELDKKVKSKKEQFDYLITLEHVKPVRGEVTEHPPLPYEEDREDGEEDRDPPDKPLPSSPTNPPTTNKTPHTEENKPHTANIKRVNPLVERLKKESGILDYMKIPTSSNTTLPESNVEKVERMEFFESRDKRWIGRIKSTIIEKNKHCIFPNLINKEEFKKEKGCYPNIHAPVYGSLPTKCFCAAQYLFYEFDVHPQTKQLISKEIQWDIAMEVNKKLPVSFIIDTGGKSLHVYISLKDIITDIGEWNKCMKGLINWLGCDPSICNINRLMAHPYLPHPNGNIPRFWKISDNQATNAQLSFLKDYYFYGQYGKKKKKVKVVKLDICKDNKTSNQAEQDIMRVWEMLPQSIPGSNDYDMFYKMAFATAQVCKKYNVSESWVESIIKSHSPLRGKDLTRAFEKSNGSISSATFYNYLNKGELPC